MRRLLYVCNYLSARDGRRSYGEDLTLHLEESGVAVIRSSNKVNKLLRGLDMLWAGLGLSKSYDCCVVEVYSGLAFLWALGVACAVKVRRKPLVIALHGGNLPVFAERWALFVKMLVRMADVVVAPSTYLQNTVGVSARRCIIIPNGIDVAGLAGRERMCVNGNLAWLRSFHEMYDPRGAIAVVAKLLNNWPHMRLHMYGTDRQDGSLERCRQMVEELALKDVVSIHGYIEKKMVGSALNECDVFINTSCIDNYPVSVLEAMACGLCVVSTDVGGIRAVVTDEIDGLLVPVGDTDAMVAAVARLRRNDELAGRLSRAAIARATECDWTNVIPRWRATIDSVLEVDCR